VVRRARILEPCLRDGCKTRRRLAPRYASAERRTVHDQLRISRGRRARTARLETVKDENRKPAPPTAVNTVTLETRGLQTKWTLVARFDSIEERDITAGMGFGHMIGQGAERMAEYLKTL